MAGYKDRCEWDINQRQLLGLKVSPNDYPDLPGQLKQEMFGSQNREGDWFCPRCGFHNYSRKVQCHECNLPRGRPQVQASQVPAPYGLDGKDIRGSKDSKGGKASKGGKDGKYGKGKDEVMGKGVLRADERIKGKSGPKHVSAVNQTPIGVRLLSRSMFESSGPSIAPGWQPGMPHGDLPSGVRSQPSSFEHNPPKVAASSVQADAQEKFQLQLRQLADRREFLVGQVENMDKDRRRNHLEYELRDKELADKVESFIQEEVEVIAKS